MKPKVYIDGQEGTTGLELFARLEHRDDLELLVIDPAKRKDADERKKLINAAELVFLCLPDDAATEAMGLIESAQTRVIDASTAHRTSPGWVYGFPELYKDPREAVGKARFVANPGCHATGFLAAAAPLTALHILPADYPLTCYSITGYSGGGKKMVAEYESEDQPVALRSPASYSTNLRHKHLPEMQKYAGLDVPPVFCPILGDFYRGMATTILLHSRYLKGQPTAKELSLILGAYYAKQKLITVAPYVEEAQRLPANYLAESDALELSVDGHEGQTIVTARFDNLGKGAAGAAVQNMNLMLGFDEDAGLRRLS